MKDFLNDNQIEYMLFHLGFFIRIDEKIREAMVFIKDPVEANMYQNRILFILSEQEFTADSVKWINSVPVLFPMEERNSFYREENGNIIFTDDLLKSSFFFLSGYQELVCKEKDSFGRFPYSSSLQKRLDIVGKPIVNYYFLEIINGIEKFCTSNNIPLQKKKTYPSFGFILSHDIDKIEKYNWNYIGYKVKEVAGRVKRQNTWLKTLYLLLISILGAMRLTKNKNPYWSFEYILDINKKLGFKSSYFFLPRDEKHADADYDLNDRRLEKLYPRLIGAGDEMGIHGTVASSRSLHKARENKLLLEKLFKQRISGIRQHRLCYEFPVTARIHEDMDYTYDTTLGFAEHIGFRNSYCLPFRLYDFENNRMFKQWQIPLTVMDVTLFAYQKYNTFEAEEAIKRVLAEVKKFNGLFTLLWHNTHLDENELKGIRSFYKNILEYIHQEGCISVTASESLEYLQKKN